MGSQRIMNACCGNWRTVDAIKRSRHVEVDAGSSREAIDDVRSKIPADEVVLFVRQLG